MSEINFKKKNEAQIGLWVPLEDKEIAVMLKREYGVDVPTELKAAVGKRLRELRDLVMLSKDIA